MTPRIHRSSQERERIAPAPSISSPTNPCPAAPLSSSTALAASPTAAANAGRSIPPSIFTPARLTSGSASTSPPALHRTVRTWIDNGRRFDQLIDRVSDHNLQTLVTRKQKIQTRQGHCLGEDPAP